MRRPLISISLLASLAACGGTPRAPEAKAPRKTEAGAAATPHATQPAHDARRKAPRGPGVQHHGQLPAERELRDIDALADDEPAFVALIVMDTLRADHMQLCGYERPNTPTLLRIKNNAKAWSCEAYSPATWTMPAHASYFTGKPTSDHGVHTLGTPLGDDYTTLAETYADRGYQTLFVSANPVFGSKVGGFWQGFDRVVVAEGLRGPLRADLGNQLKDIFGELDPAKPVFLVLNIFDAHDPYPEVPAGLDWVDAQPRFSLKPHTAEDSNPYYRFVTGTMAEAEKGPYLAKIRDAYDHAVFAADANLGVTIKGFQRMGWLKAKHRIVITSDHGEHLGEHGLLRHGSATWQTVTKVPFLYFDNLRTTPMPLPEPLSATTAYHLLRDGAAPTPPLDVTSASTVNPQDFKPSWVTVATWSSTTDKLMQFDGEVHRYDLATDPGEEHPLAPDAEPEVRASFDAHVEGHLKSLETAANRDMEPEVLEMLKAVGYIQ